MISLTQVECCWTPRLEPDCILLLFFAQVLGFRESSSALEGVRVLDKSIDDLLAICVLVL